MRNSKSLPYNTAATATITTTFSNTQLTRRSFRLLLRRADMRIVYFGRKLETGNGFLKMGL